jgi:hypothetical protein
VTRFLFLTEKCIAPAGFCLKKLQYFYNSTGYMKVGRDAQGIVFIVRG